MNSNEKVVLVTGGAAGIGLAISKAFAKAGYKIAVHYHSSEAAAQALVNEIVSNGGHAHAFRANIAEYAECERLIKETIEVFGRIDILVNNAGIAEDGVIIRLTEDQFDRVIATDLKAVWSLSKNVVRPMMKQGWGRIINITSVSGILGNYGQTNYSAAKAGVIGMTKSLAREFATKNITINAVAPGFIDTAMTRKLNEQIVEMAKKSIPIGRFGQPEEIASMVLFLAGEEANYITGQTIAVDGGLSMH